MLIQNVVLVLLYLLLCLGLSRLFPLAGQKAYTAFIPIYNFIIWIRIIIKPWWWVIPMFAPGINFVMLAVLSVQLAKVFGKKGLQELAIAAILPYFYFNYLPTVDKLTFTPPPEKKEKKRSATVEWVDSILFAVIAATVIRTFFLEAFTIPTSSLEKSLMVGDYLFVSKMSYGAKLPNTPLSYPFSHHTLPLTKSIKSYLEWIKIPYVRLPGFGKVKNNDIVVFNYPDGDTVALNLQNQSYYQLCRDAGRNQVWDPRNKATFGDIVARPPDKRENYIKRCVAIAGDEFEIKDKKVFINGKENPAAPTAQFNYIVIITDPSINTAIRGNRGSKWLDDLDITEKPQAINVDDPYKSAWMITLTEEKAKRLEKLAFVEKVLEDFEKKGEDRDGRNEIFPHNPNYKWNKDNFGPLKIPKAGETVTLNTQNLALYDRIIDVYENNDLEIKGEQIFINGKPADSYTFKMDYYFMMGDNRHNSADSRYWGLVPEDHIVGTPVFVWMSLKDPAYNPYSGPFQLSKFFTGEGKMRWNRVFTTVDKDGISRSYFVHFLVLVGLFQVFKFIRRRRKKAKTA